MHRLVVVGVLVARTAHADTVDSPSPAVAASLSVVVTVGGAALMAGGFTTDNHDLREAAVIAGGLAVIAGPSVGHWYAGELRPTTGTVVRGIGLGVAALGLGVAIANCGGQIAYDNEIHSCSPRESTFGIAAITVGVAGFIAGSVYEIWTTPRDVRRENASRWTMAPLVTPHLMGAAVGTAF